MTTDTMRASSTIIELARDIMAVCAPTTGTRATGKVLVKTKGDEKVDLQRNWPMIPIINGAAREDLAFKVGAGPEKARFPNGIRKKADPDEPDTESWWQVQPGGSIVGIHSIIGGHRHNLPRGTKFVFDPVNPKLEVEAVLQSDITDGADPTHFGGCKSMMMFEQLSGNDATLDAWRAQLGKFPGVVIVWDGSQPADGTTQSPLQRGQTRIGTAQQLFTERFNLFVLSERLDSGHLRRSEGLKLLDDLTGWLSDRQEVDGQIFSSPSGVQIRGRSRLAGNNQAYQVMYVYLLSLSVTTLLRPYDDRTFNPWLRVHNEILTHEKDGDGERLTTVRQDIDMTKVPE